MQKVMQPQSLNSNLTEAVLDEKSATPSDFIEGEIKPITSSGLRGWVWDKSKPYHPLTVELYANNELLADALADEFEMELVEKQIGNGKHAFTLQAKSWPDLPLPVRLEVRVANCTHVLADFQINNIRDIEGLATTAPAGHVDGVANGEINGWAIDRANPSSPIDVDLIVDGQIISSTTCSIYRSDLKAAGYSDGHCGFSIPMPLDLLDGEMHSITICFSDTQTSLPNSTMLYGLSKESNLTKSISNIFKTVERLKAEFSLAEKRLLDRHEALLSIQRENIERELQSIRKILIDKSDGTQSHSEPVSSKKPTSAKRSAPK